jgi:transposase
MTQHSHLPTSTGLDYDRTLILAVEVSSRSWIVAAQVPGLQHKGVKESMQTCGGDHAAAVALWSSFAGRKPG